MITHVDPDAFMGLEGEFFPPSKILIDIVISLAAIIVFN